MKKLVFIATAALLMGGCSSVEKKAGELLEQARGKYEQGNYLEARQLIDSIKTTYPKAFQTREKSQELMAHILLSEQEKTLAYLDGEMKKQEAEVEKIRGNFIFEKDAKYQRIGIYLYPNQVVEKRIHQTYLKFQTDEQGRLYLTSVYCGPHYLHHHHVKATADGGTFVDTPSPHDRYEGTDLGKKIEKVSFKLDQGANFIRFIHAHRDQPLSIELTGEKNYSYRLSKGDITAAVQIFRLSELLASLERMKGEREEAERKLEFVKKKMEEKEWMSQE